MKWVIFFHENSTKIKVCCIPVLFIKFLEKFYSTQLHYKRSDLDVLMPVKLNNLN